MKKKLTLKKETIKKLNDKQLTGVRAGAQARGLSVLICTGPWGVCFTI